MKYIREDDLQVRAKDILNNLIVLNETAKISLPRISRNTEYWMILWTHILEEFVIRYGPYPGGFESGFMKDLRIPDPRKSLASKAANVVKTTLLPEGEYLFKYGKFKHLKAPIDENIIRVSPASAYADPSLNPAIRDEELKLSINPLPSEVKMHAFDGKTGAFKGEIESKNIIITSRSNTNYYVYCFSLSFAPRLFLDFDADSCLVIRNPWEFGKLLISTFEKQLNDWIGVGNRVTYIDPLNSPTSQIDVFFFKHFRYSYQREYRIVWIPKSEKQILDPVFIQVPDMKNYCYLVDLHD